MSRGSGWKGSLRTATAAGMLAVFLVLALPCSSQASMLERDNGQQAWLEQEDGFWQRLWHQVVSLWRGVSVLIDPNGSDGGDDPESPQDPGGD